MRLQAYGNTLSLARRIALLFSVVCAVGFVMGATETQAALPAFQAAGTATSSAVTVRPAWPAHEIDDFGLLFICINFRIGAGG
ncbi:MAG: hypothetical protein A2939_05810 [Parcubacteria group bacterium RIFCSPLOWO2_01_FULL_48_18]|nr:MAG: hypothetical protein A2939_05810 [Parcubacteria group bacterium RIFCSPLOWO2_01_FULL_48_18]